jgi:hypothetical protein
VKPIMEEFFSDMLEGTIGGVKLGLTREAVIEILGPPESENDDVLHYGYLQVWLENGVVARISLPLFIYINKKHYDPELKTLLQNLGVIWYPQVHKFMTWPKLVVELKRFAPMVPIYKIELSREEWLLAIPSSKVTIGFDSQTMHALYVNNHSGFEKTQL